jgi:hypothetical protein
MARRMSGCFDYASTVGSRFAIGRGAAPNALFSARA